MGNAIYRKNIRNPGTIALNILSPQFNSQLGARSIGNDIYYFSNLNKMKAINLLGDLVLDETTIFPSMTSILNCFYCNISGQDILITVYFYESSGTTRTVYARTVNLDGTNEVYFPLFTIYNYYDYISCSFLHVSEKIYYILTTSKSSGFGVDSNIGYFNRSGSEKYNISLPISGSTLNTVGPSLIDNGEKICYSYTNSVGTYGTTISYLLQNPVHSPLINASFGNAVCLTYSPISNSIYYISKGTLETYPTIKKYSKDLSSYSIIDFIETAGITYYNISWYVDAIGCIYFIFKESQEYYIMEIKTESDIVSISSSTLINILDTNITTVKYIGSESIKLGMYGSPPNESAYIFSGYFSAEAFNIRVRNLRHKTSIPSEVRARGVWHRTTVSTGIQQWTGYPQTPEPPSPYTWIDQVIANGSGRVSLYVSHQLIGGGGEISYIDVDSTGTLLKMWWCAEYRLIAGEWVYWNSPTDLTDLLSLVEESNTNIYQVGTGNLMFAKITTAEQDAGDTFVSVRINQ